MSSIGKNIKKIRGVKGLSQSDFADLFNLKRASIGAYEEGRAEPKLATIVEIANYFGISVDELLKKDLSVNDLYHFDIFRKDLIKGAKHNLRPSKLPPGLVNVPLVSQSLKGEYLANRDSVSKMAKLSLPLSRDRDYRAFELGDNSMLAGDQGFAVADIVVAYKDSNLSLERLEEGRLYLFETSDDWRLRRVLEIEKEKISLKAFSSNFYEEELLQSELKAFWQVERVITKNISSVSNLQEQIDMLKNQISKLSRKVES